MDVHPRQRLECAGKHAVEEHHERVVDDRAGIAQRLAKRIFDCPSVVKSSTSRVRLPSGTSPSISALRPNPLAFLRTYAIGADIRSAIQAANGMPAVSPPATASIVSYPMWRLIFSTAKLADLAPARAGRR